MNLVPVRTRTQEGIRGRALVLETLAEMLDEGRTVLLYGPVGVGKTTVLRAIQRRAAAQGKPCGVAVTTDTLADLAGALALAYPATDTRSGTKRHVRSRLRSAVERRPGVLLLDHLGHTGTAFKGALRALRGTGTGVLIAADVEQPRDHERVRHLGLAHREVELTPLRTASICALLRSLIANVRLPFALGDADLRSLAAATDGLPGRAVRFVDALAHPVAWSHARPRCEWLRREAIIAAAESYRSREL